MENDKLKFKIILIILIFLFGIFGLAGRSQAAQYFYFDAESGTVGSALPNPPFCQKECTGLGSKGTYQTIGGTPQGTKYYQWQTVANQLEARTVIDSPSMPVACSLGTTYYLAYYFNFSRINNLDIWHISGQSADKGVEMDGYGIRWVVSRGSWETYLVNNQDHHYTIWLGNPTFHLNSELEIVDALVTNQNGYSRSNPIQLHYEHWYSIVMGVKMATDNTGVVTVWLNGQKVIEYTNIKTAAYISPTIDVLTINGTIAQPAYDAPAHYRRFDAFMLTDNWQDIIDGSYLQAPGTSDTTPPAAPSGVSVQ
jgi:hypothetical protein